jgi:curved DNA-binding protein CbpA
VNVIEAKQCLGLSEDGLSEDSLKKCYRQQISKWHPDRHVGEDACRTATEKSKQINRAYEILSELIEELGEEAFQSSNNQEREYAAQHRYRGDHFTPGFPDETVLEVFVKSSHIVSAGYNARELKLFIKFLGDRVYEYSSVPESIFEGLVSAQSPGRFANKSIYKTFEYRRCSEPNKPYVGFLRLQ